MRGRCQGAPARVVDRTDPRRGLFGPPHVCGHLLSPSCQDSSRGPWSGRSTSPAVQERSRAVRGRCQGAPARVVDRTDPRRGLFGPPHVCGHLLSPSCQDSSRRPWSGRSTSPAVRSVPRSARGRCGGVAKGRPRVWWTAQACGAAPPARWSRYITERREGVSASSIVSTYQHWLVQLVVMCASFPRSVPRAAAPGGPPEGTPPTHTLSRASTPLP